MQKSPVPILQRINHLIIAAGHGGKDPGACNGPHKEAEQAIRMVDRIAALLTPHLPPGTLIKAPHGGDTHETIPWMNKTCPERAWAIELHRDSGINAAVQPTAANWRCGIYHGHHRNSRETADCMAQALRTAGAHSSTWAKSMDKSRFTSLGWITQPKMLSHIVEAGFLDGDNSDAHLDALALTVARAIFYTFTGGQLPEEPVEEPAP